MPAHDVLAAESASLELSGTHSCQLFRAPDPNAKMCPLFLAGFSGGNNPPLRSATVRAHIHIHIHIYVIHVIHSFPLSPRSPLYHNTSYKLCALCASHRATI